MLASIKTLLFFTLLTGVFYPLVMTAFAQLFFPYKANGSIVIKAGKAIGSELLAQPFTQEHYFWPRPSASNYSLFPSGASNQAPTSKLLHAELLKRQQHSDPAGEEMLFSSASGLDPHVSPVSASLQIQRIAKARKLTDDQILKLHHLVFALTKEKEFAILGQPRVNILLLNLALDEMEMDKEGAFGRGKTGS
ncbi:MAG: potassium-transporting ATPase subunit KdpC [Oligoflexia bacterium]|nr:potassium-transporting ATPase subunit KdpC [Oligoflexia bacterium]